LKYNSTPSGLLALLGAVENLGFASASIGSGSASGFLVADIPVRDIPLSAAYVVFDKPSQIDAGCIFYSAENRHG
jgi:hypothetical protein